MRSVPRRSRSVPRTARRWSWSIAGRTVDRGHALCTEWVQMMKRALLLAAAMLVTPVSSAAADPAPMRRRIAAVDSGHDQNRPGPFTETITFEQPLAGKDVECDVR